MWSISKPRRGLGATAMFVRVAAGIVEDIRGGVLRAGDRLPSTRALAERFDVNRNTIVAAYDELIAQGWVSARGQAGTFVCDEIPERAPPPRTAMAARAGFAVRSIAPLPSLPFGPAEARYHLSAGVPDTRLVPRVELARAYRRALRSPRAKHALDYADPRGTPRLRTAIAAMLRATRAIPTDAEHILVTRGSQMGLDLAARLLIGAGDVVAVERLGYRPAWRAFEEAGARLSPIAIDDAGLVVDSIARGARCVYATPHHQYPTTVLLSPARRSALLARARRDNIAVIEDDYDHEFHFVGRPVAPLAALDRGSHVIYLGSLSKILAPGLRLGFVAAAPHVIEQLARLRASVDRQGDHVLEHAIAEMLEEGELQRHARKMRRIYAARRDALVATLHAELAGALSFELPAGGITIWARVADDIRLDSWRTHALARGVAIATARDFDLEARPAPYVRLAYGHYNEAELADAVRRLARALDDARRRPSSARRR